MSDHPPDQNPPTDPGQPSDSAESPRLGSSEKPIPCQRLDRDLPVSEHAKCPYCLGQKSEIRTGEHSKFCDFHKGEDPVHFGFPDDLSRNVRG